MPSFVEERIQYVFKSTMKDVDIPDDVSLPDFIFERFSKLDADAPAMTNGVTGKTFTIGDLQKGTRAVASGLTRRKFAKGDTMAIILPNCPEYFMIFQGVALVGGIATTVNPTYNASSIAHQFTDASVKMVVTIPMFLDKVREAAKIAGKDLAAIFVIAPADAATGEGTTPFSDLTSDDGSLAPSRAPVNPKTDLVALPYSSGTTGLPKGVMLTHYNIIANICQISDADEMLDLTPKDAVMAVLPFFHIYGMVLVKIAALIRGAHVVSIPRFDKTLFLSLIQKHNISFLPLVPPLVLFLAKDPTVKKYDISSVREIVCGAAPLGPELTQIALKALPGVKIRQGYGMTEMSPASHISPGSFQEPGSCGVQVPNMVSMLVDPDTGRSVGIGGRGELWLKGPNVMKGYLGNKAATASTIDSQGWIHTGDIATVDENGNFFIVDRLKELIKVKGFQVAPAELEAILQGHPSLADAAVIPVPDEIAGELPKAFVVLKAEEKVSEDEVKAYVAEKVEKYKRLGYVEFVKSIPKSASGKILRRILKKGNADAKK